MPANNPPFCNPGQPYSQGRIHAYIAEVLQLSPAEIRAVMNGLQGAPTATAPATDTYKVPADQDLIVLSAQGYLQFATLNSEPTAMLGWLNLDPSERWFVKAQNCNVQLENIDRSLEVMDARALPMSAITPPVGAPAYFNPELPFIVPAGHSLRATFTLNDSNTTIVGGTTTYGILLVGALIPRRV